MGDYFFYKRSIIMVEIYSHFVPNITMGKSIRRSLFQC